MSLLSYDSGDASLNTSGSVEVHNWIGPAGSYWSDALFQLFGVGAFALAVGLFFAAWRALRGIRIRPGFREGAGSVLLVICVGALAELLMAGTEHSYPPGGVAGAILAQVLVENFALVGSYVLATALVLLSLAVTADGILAGLGLKGLGVLLRAGLHMKAAYVVFRERRRCVQEARVDIHALPEVGDHWTLGQIVIPKPGEEKQERWLERARQKGREMGEAQAARERDLARARALRDVSEPDIHIDRTVDLVEEENFELGALPGLDELVTPPPAPEPAEKSEPPERIAPEIAIRAATPEPDLEPKTAMEAAPEADVAAPEPAPRQSDAPPKRLGKVRRSKSVEPEIVDVRPEVDVAAIERAVAEKPEAPPRSFDLPSASLLDLEAVVRAPLDPQRMRENAQRLTKTLKDYGIDGHVREIRPGPVVTMYEYVPGPGIKLSKIASLADDLAMSMEALRVRIVAPIPGKGAVGIEIPNDNRETVFLKEIIAHDSFRRAKSNLTMSLGKDIEGRAYVVDLAKMPHLLVAGATGAGKSVSINAMIMSILFKATPDEVRMIMVDPKRLELRVYDDIPHLLLPVVTDPKKASLALRWAVEEMERRYQLLSEVGVRSIDGYNKKVRAAEERGQPLTIPGPSEDEPDHVCQTIPYIVVVVDELADLMMVASREVEASIMRLAQMARAAGIHLILATQRPSVDVITGVIKANFPTRIAFQVASKHDSRTIIDTNGAEHLLGRGDMLYLSPGVGGLVRVHGAYVSDEEIERTVGFLKGQAKPEYDESILAPREDGANDAAEEEDKDEMYDQAVAIVAETRQASISMIQRRLRIGYNRAARMVERMETEGIVGAADGAKPRQVLISPAPL